MTANLIKKYSAHFDTFFSFSEWVTLVNAAQYILIKERYLTINESKMNFNYYLREDLKIEQDVRRKIMQSFEAYELPDEEK
jgi:hypothetical protein